VVGVGFAVVGVGWSVVGVGGGFGGWVVDDLSPLDGVSPGAEVVVGSFFASGPASAPAGSPVEARASGDGGTGTERPITVSTPAPQDPSLRRQ
jgi:hypothetical protein